MAYRLTRASSQRFSVDLPAPTDGAISLGMWVKLASLPASATAANRFALAARVQANNAAGYYSYLSNTALAVQFHNGGYIGTEYAFTLDTNWHHLGMVWDFSTTTAELKGYLDGALLGSNTYTRGTVTTTSTSGFLGWLNTPGAAGHLDGTIAEAAVWNASLTDDEWAQLAEGLSPRGVRPDLLRRHWALVRDVNETVRGTTITATNSPTVADHPRVYQ